MTTLRIYTSVKLKVINGGKELPGQVINYAGRRFVDFKNKNSLSLENKNPQT